MLVKAYFVKIFDQIGLEGCIIFIFSPEFLDLFRYRKQSNQFTVNLQQKTNESITSSPAKQELMIPLIPPPRTSHISFKAALSLLLFSSLGTPSDGVISPTIAIKFQTQINLKKSMKQMYIVKNLLIMELLILYTGEGMIKFSKNHQYHEIIQPFFEKKSLAAC